MRSCRLPLLTGGQPAGWHRTLPLQYRTGHSLSFDTGGTSDEAEISRLQSLATAQAEGPHYTSRRMGRRQRPWSHNCVALGAAAGAVEPIEASEVDVARAGIMALISLIPDRGPMLAEAEAFNRVMEQELAEQRDSALLHQVMIENDEPVLRVAGEKSALPDSLAHRIALFRGRGRLLPHAGPWAPADWLAVLLGRGVIPASWDPLADDIEHSVPSRTSCASPDCSVSRRRRCRATSIISPIIAPRRRRKRQRRPVTPKCHTVSDRQTWPGLSRVDGKLGWCGLSDRCWVSSAMPSRG